MKKCILPEKILRKKKQVEVVNELKLLECILDSKIKFNRQLKNLRATVLKKNLSGPFKIKPSSINKTK